MLDNQGIESLIGRTFKGYRVTRFIARGGMGMVFAGVQESLDRPVAIKFLYPHLSDDDQFRERFEREARAAAQLNHPNVVRILDFGSEGALHYMVLDLIDGESLRDRLARIHSEGLTFGTDKIIDILRQVGAALSDAHSVGYVHRDVKPGNILLTEDGRALLTDFGVVKVLGSTQMTTTGTMIGTPEYMAPEQSSGATEIGPAADLYSLAVIAYEMMTGRVPFQAPTPVAVMKMHMTDPPPPPSTIAPSFPPAAEAVLMQALAKDPSDRQASVDEFIESLAAAVREPGQSTVFTPAHDQSVAAYMAGNPGAGHPGATMSGSGTIPPATHGPATGRPRWMIAGGVAGLLLLAILLGGFLMSRFGGDDDGSSPLAAASDETPTPTLTATPQSPSAPAATATTPAESPGAADAGETDPTATEPPPTATATSPPPPTDTPEPTATATEPEAVYTDPTATPEGEAEQPVILFASNRGDGENAQIYAMNPDGSDQQQLTSVEGQSRNPRVSPDGEWFIFTVDSSGDDGYGYGTGEEGEGGADIYIASANGEDVTNLTADYPSWDGQPSWSPDGETIVFVSDRDGNREIYTMARDGQNVTRLTEDPAQDGWPSWTPDGERIVFASDRSGIMEIYSMNGDGSDVQQLTNRPYMLDTYPVVSPDSTQIAFASQDPESGASEIYVMNLDDGYVTQLTNAGGVNTAPTWSPDGEQIAFVSDRDENWNVYAVNADGSGQTDGSDQTRLTDDPGEDMTPAWTSTLNMDGSQQY